MLLRSKMLLIATLVSAGAACDSGRHSTRGFRLPADGDSERGRQAFVTLGCHECHGVSGMDLPEPTARDPVPLGGEVAKKLSDAYLLTAMINPNYQLAPYDRAAITRNGASRMPNYSDRMTVRQAEDVVAFLQSRYVERPPMPTYNYH